MGVQHPQGSPNQPPLLIGPDNKRSPWRAITVIIALILFILGISFLSSPFIAALFNGTGLFFTIIQIDFIRAHLLEGVKDAGSILLEGIRPTRNFLRSLLQTPIYWTKQRRRQITMFILAIVPLGLILHFLVLPLVFPGPAPHPIAPAQTISSLTVMRAGDDGIIGLSEGGTIFDTDRINTQFKENAAQAFNAKDFKVAGSYWQLAIREDETDAEPLIYQEDQHILKSRAFTIVVIASLSGDNMQMTQIGRDIIQGAYVSQHEYNDPNDSKHKLYNGTQIRLIIANIGTHLINGGKIAQIIIQEAKLDDTFIGITGQFSALDDAAVQTLKAAHIPMLSSTQLLTPTGAPYLFSVAPSIPDEATAAATYARTITQSVAILYDEKDSYSKSLAQDFEQQFKAQGGAIYEDIYTTGQTSYFSTFLNHIEALGPPKLIYFPGYPEDARALLAEIHNQSLPVQILGNNALYQFVHLRVPQNTFAGLLLTAFSFHDEWQGQISSQPSFLNDYKNDFAYLKQYAGNPYGYQVPDAEVALSYDATSTLLEASGRDLDIKKQFPIFQKVWQKLQSLTTDHPVQGFSGQITFRPDGQPLEKAIVVLEVLTPGSRIVWRWGHYI